MFRPQGQKKKNKNQSDDFSIDELIMVTVTKTCLFTLENNYFDYKCWNNIYGNFYLMHKLKWARIANMI